jgi:hypothetical protein
MIDISRDEDKKYLSEGMAGLPSLKRRVDSFAQQTLALLLKVSEKRFFQRSPAILATMTMLQLLDLNRRLGSRSIRAG